MTNLHLSNDFNINFKATPEELKSIKKACNYLSTSVSAKPVVKQSIDVAEIGSKAFISKIQNGNETLVKIELNNGKGANAYTLINTQSPENTNKFLSCEKSIRKIGDILDSLKETVQRTMERESYTD